MPNATVRSWSIAATVCAMTAFAAHADEAKTAQAVWKSQELTFYYQNTAGSFSCDGFKRKVTRILKALGAADSEIILRPADCGADSGSTRQPLVSMKIRSPVEATPEAIAAADDKQPFAATWRTVSLSRGRLTIEPSDCSLIDQLRQLMLPKMAVRVIDDNIDCFAGAISSAQPNYKVEALVPAS